MPGPWFLLKADLEVPDERLRALRVEPAEDGPPETAAIEKVLESALPGMVESAALEWTRGTFHWVARGRLRDGNEIATRVLRLDRPELREGLVVGAKAAAWGRSSGLPAPAPLACSLEGKGPPLVVFTWLAGASLSRWDHDEALTARVLGQLGEMLRKLHEVAGAGAGGVVPAGEADAETVVGRHADWQGFLSCRLEEHLSRCRVLGAIGADDSDRAVRWLLEGDWHQEGATDRLMHGDAGPANLLVDDAGQLAGLLDWEDAMVGDPIFELASCASFQPERRWPSLFEGYLGRPTLPVEVEGRFWRYSLRLALARTVARARFGLTDLPGRVPAASRVQRAVSVLTRGGW